MASKPRNVPNQFFGYSYQEYRCLHYLLTGRDGSSVSIEVFEDVGVQSPDGDGKICEQQKFTKDGNPIADRSAELWKTFAGWISDIETGKLDAVKDKFILCVAIPKESKFAALFSAAKNIEEANEAINSLEEEFWGSAPKFLKKKTIAKTLAPYINKVLSCDRNILANIIVNFELIFGTGSASNDLKSEISKSLVPDHLQDDFLNYSLGWVKLKIGDLIQGGVKAIVPINDFRGQMKAWVSKHNRVDVLTSVAEEPEQEEVESQLSTAVYIAQLHLVECTIDEMRRAAIDFLKASIDRTQWAFKCLVEAQSFSEFAQELLSTWKNKKAKIELTCKQNTESERGKLVYLDCDSHVAKLESKELPPHFTRGSFHNLADEIQLGWHPSYLTLLKEKKAKSE